METLIHTSKTAQRCDEAALLLTLLTGSGCSQSGDEKHQVQQQQEHLCSLTMDMLMCTPLASGSYTKPFLMPLGSTFTTQNEGHFGHHTGLLRVNVVVVL